VALIDLEALGMSPPVIGYWRRRGVLSSIAGKKGSLLQQSHVSAELGDRHHGAQPGAPAVDDMEVGGETNRDALIAEPFLADLEGRAVGRVGYEVRLIDVTWI
jgi:hypothetical protein